LANKGGKFFNCSLRLNQVAALAAVAKPQIFIIRTSKAFLISRQSAKPTTTTAATITMGKGKAQTSCKFTFPPFLAFRFPSPFFASYCYVCVCTDEHTGKNKYIFKLVLKGPKTEN